MSIHAYSSCLDQLLKARLSTSKSQSPLRTSEPQKFSLGIQRFIKLPIFMNYILPRRWVMAIVALVVVINLLFYYQYTVEIIELFPETLVTGVWKFDHDHKYYVVDSELVADSNLRSVLEKAEALPIPGREVKKVIVEKFTANDGAKLKKIEKEVHEKYLDEFTKEFRKVVIEDVRGQMSRDYASVFFMNMVKSYEVLDQQRAEYLKTNEEKILNGVLHGLLVGTSDQELKSKIDALDRLLVDRTKYFHFLIDDVILKHAPREPQLTTLAKGKEIGGNMLNELGLTYSRNFLTDKRTKLNEVQFKELQERHDEIVRDLRSMSMPPPEIYSGEGIVIVSDKVSIPAAIGLVVQLREVKSELPVEVVINSEEDYNSQVCEEILPKFNAKCKVIERELTSEKYSKLGLKHFQMKMMAILVSSFDHTIVLDADNWPTKSPDFLFSTEPYRETRFILWPDAWHKGTSPLYYDIARFEVGEIVHRNGWSNEEPFSEYIVKDVDKEVMFHDFDGLPPFRGVESGQIVVSKREHFRSLFLAAYYNFYGPQFYYPLLYQGTFGSGDRETYIPALHVMNEPYNLCDYEMTFMGVERKDFKGENSYMDESTMVQRDPQQSLRYIRAWRGWLKSKGLDSRLDPFQGNKYTEDLRMQFVRETSTEIPEALFMHVHDPKINALYNEQSEKTRYDYKSRYIREIGKFDEILGSTDWELKFQTINMWVTCEALKRNEIWKSFLIDQEATCQKMMDYVSYLAETSNDVTSGDIKAVDVLSGHLKQSEENSGQDRASVPMAAEKEGKEKDEEKAEAQPQGGIEAGKKLE